MSNWTRAHDAWIARECEGLEVWVNASDGAICDFQDDSIPHYLTDPAAAIRAAEAWRKKDEENRWYQYESPLGKGLHAVRIWWDVQLTCAFGTGDDFAGALAQALLRATGGPE